MNIFYHNIHYISYLLHHFYYYSLKDIQFLFFLNYFENKTKLNLIFFIIIIILLFRLSLLFKLVLDTSFDDLFTSLNCLIYKSLCSDFKKNYNLNYHFRPLKPL